MDQHLFSFFAPTLLKLIIEAMTMTLQNLLGLAVAKLVVPTLSNAYFINKCQEKEARFVEPISASSVAAVVRGA
jgi:hypothetical protein